MFYPFGKIKGAVVASLTILIGVLAATTASQPMPQTTTGSPPSLASGDLTAANVSLRGAKSSIPPGPEIWPNDPLLAIFPNSARAMDLPKAWAVTTCSPLIVAEEIDTGIISDPAWNADLVPNLLATYNGLDGSSDGTDTTPTSWPSHGHGTAQASVAFAVGNNGIGTAGVCWNAKFMMAKYYGSSPIGSWDAIAADIYWGISRGARVINIEASGNAPANVNAAIAYAHSHGSVVVIAAGNGTNENGVGSSDPDAATLASANTEAIRVADYSLDELRIASSSNYGPWVDVAAVGGGPADGPQSRLTGGTSGAAAVITGLATMLLSYRPDLTPDQVKSYIMASCVTPTQDKLDVACGGLVNAYKMLIAAGYVPPKQLIVNTAGNGSGMVKDGGSVQCRSNGQSCTGYYKAGSSISLEAIPSPGSLFTGWSGACTGKSPVCSMTMNADTQVTANFAIKKAVLALTVTGNGSACVVGKPTCVKSHRYSFTAGLVIKLRAKPATKWHFVRWTGKVDHPNQAITTLTMGTSKAVTAVFAKNPIRKLPNRGVIT